MVDVENRLHCLSKVANRGTASHFAAFQVTSTVSIDVALVMIANRVIVVIWIWTGPRFDDIFDQRRAFASSAHLGTAIQTRSTLVICFAFSVALSNAHDIRSWPWTNPRSFAMKNNQHHDCYEYSHHFFVFVSLKAKRSQLKYQEKNSIFVCEIIFEEKRNNLWGEEIRFCYGIKL